MSRIDFPQNAGKLIPWTLDLTTVGAYCQNPSTAAQEGEYPVNALDVRRCRGYSVQLVPNTVVGSATVEIQWSNDGVNFISLGTGYQLTIPAGSPSPSNGLLVSNPWYQFIRIVTLSAATSGNAKIILAARD